MALSIRVHATGHAIVVDLTGDADPATLDPLAESLRAALADGHHVIVHLDHLDLDTDSADALLAALTNPTTSLRLHVVAPDPATRDQLRDLGADRAIAVYPSLDGALDAAARRSRSRPETVLPPARRRSLPR